MNTASATNTASNTIIPSEQDQFAWHRKPQGWSGAPCPVCGCTTPRLKALHRALTAEESWGYRPIDNKAVLWIKSVKVCFGTDFSWEPLS